MAAGTRGAHDLKNRDPIAILGIGCRFPGGIKDSASYWRFLRRGDEAIGDVPRERFDIKEVYDPRPKVPGKIVTRRGGFLQGIDLFDPGFFGISPREAARMDPQQRLLLEVAWEAIEDAGQIPARLSGSSTGTYLGVCYGDFEDLQFERPTTLEVYSLIGGFRSVAAGRIAYHLGLEGPCLTVDTACSSSLVAIHLACQALWAKECDLALAGGVNLILHPQVSIGFSQAGMLAPDGRCKFGDAHSDGFVRSEGLGIIVLKPLAATLRDGDPVYAVIRASAVNDDGRSSGFLMNPSRRGQEEVIRSAWRRAGVSPGELQYVEAHGTGTRVGDVVELEALGAALETGQASGQWCSIGSVKTNLGHTEGASGVAGLIKAALSIAHRELPASLHFKQPNPRIPWDQLPLKVQAERGPWPRPDLPLVAGVTSIGISGTNAHAVVAEAPPIPERPGTEKVEGPEGSDVRPYLLTLSGHTPETLRARAKQILELLTPDAEWAAPETADLCFTLAARRTHHEHRLAAVGRTPTDLRRAMDDFLQGRQRPQHVHGHALEDRRVVFVFPGQGAQWSGMGCRLLRREPIFRQTLERFQTAIAAEVGWSLIEELTAGPERSRLNEIAVVQPMLFALEVALAELWRSWGLEPAAVIGHSMGEVAAAYVAGALSLEDAVRVICRRSSLLGRTSGQGAMAVVELSFGEAQALVEERSDVSVAVSNSPTSTVLSGDPEVLEEILEELGRREIFCRLVKVDVASHSPQMDPLQGPLEEALAGLQPQAGEVPIASTVLGEMTDGSQFDARYWMQNLRRPVLFSHMIDHLSGGGHDVFVEMSPHPLLVEPIREGLRHTGREGLAVGSLRREEDEEECLLRVVAALHVGGVELRWEAFWPGGRRVLRLPHYPWQRRSLGVKGMGEGAPSRGRGHGGHPLLGVHTALAHAPGEHLWERDLDLAATAFLLDHRVEGASILPGAAMVEMALAACRNLLGEGALEIRDLEFQHALPLPQPGTEAGLPQLQLSLAEGGDGFRFRVHGRQGGDGCWSLLAGGQVGMAGGGEEPVLAASETVRALEDIRCRCPGEEVGAAFYRRWAVRGNRWGTAFQGISMLRLGPSEALVQIVLPEERKSELGLYHFHPALLDACLQALAAALPADREEGEERNGALVLSGLGRMVFRGSAEEVHWSHAVLAEEGKDHFQGRVVALDAEGRPVAELDGVRLELLAPRRRRKGALQEDPAQWTYELRWEAAQRKETGGAEGLWILLSDHGEVGEHLAELLRQRGAETRVQAVTGPEVAAQLCRWMERASSGEPPVCRGIVHLGSLDLPSLAGTEDTPDGNLPIESVLARMAGALTTVLKALAQSSPDIADGGPPPLWLVTRGAQAVGGQDSGGTEAQIDPAQAFLWGLGRVVVNECPDLPCRRIDLAPGVGREAAGLLLEELLTSDGEDEVALRGTNRFVHRLESVALPEADPVEIPANDRDFHLEFAEPGQVESLELRPICRQAPEAGQVEIEVRSAALNFRDVLKALGMYPGLEGEKPKLGDECTGIVSAVGPGVEGLALGDRVVAVAPGSFATRVLADARLVTTLPLHLGDEETVTLPVAFLTAHYALNFLGRLSAGERLLVHSAAGGVGLAALQLARSVGARVYATAGSAEKRALLEGLGAEAVFDSRSLAFARQIEKATGGEGVDVILNSLAGKAMHCSLALLRPFGRFLELGKTDIYRDETLGLSVFKNNIAYFSIDLEDLFQHRPQVAGELLREVIARCGEGGDLQPLPSRTFPIVAAREAFRHMAQARHIGKVLLSFAEPGAVSLRLPPGAVLEDSGVQVITGGLGGLGLELARWLVLRGARHLLLLGRRSPSQTAALAVDELRTAGARVEVAQADVADRRKLASVLAEMRAAEGPITGVFHLAGQLDDGILEHLDEERFLKVARPKVAGAWNLHLLTQQDPLARFVLFSSAAAVLGSPGQGNYAAANAFLDALAHYRRQRGEPALSVNWGTWSDVGLAARPDRGSRLARRGLEAMAPERALEVLGRLLEGEAGQTAVMPMDWGRFRNHFPISERSPLFSRCLPLEGKGETSLDQSHDRSRLSSAAVAELLPEERRAWVEDAIGNALGAILGIEAETLDPVTPLVRLGLDSLSAVELRNRLESELGVSLPVVRFLDGRSATLRWVADGLLEKLRERSDAPPMEPGPEIDPGTDVEALTDREVDAMLSQLLEEDVG